MISNVFIENHSLDKKRSFYKK